MIIEIAGTSNLSYGAGTKKYKVVSLCISIIIAATLAFVRCDSKGEMDELQVKYLGMFDHRKRSFPSIPPKALDLPDISNISAACPPKAFFYDRNLNHMRAIQELQAILKKPKSIIETIALATRLHQTGKIHPKVWKEAVISATETRIDMRHLAKPALVEILPDMFVNYKAIRAVLDEAVLPQYKRKCIVLDETFGEDNGKENALWYFREDLMANSMHWYWHKAYPPFPKPVIEADRRGELFYYFHRNIIARYDTERMSLGFSRVLPLAAKKNMIMEEGYFPHLNDTVSAMTYSDRFPNTRVEDVRVPSYFNSSLVNVTLKLDNLITYRSRIEKAIDDRRITDVNGTTISLNNRKGIDILENILETTSFSKNREYYGKEGGLHNEGHIIIAWAPNAAEPNKEIPPGPMVDTSISFRDPIFYRWHKFLDDLFVRHQRLLPPHTPTGGGFPLFWNAKAISKFEVRSFSGETNSLKTYWSHKKFDLSRGLDLYEINNKTENNPLYLCVKHLNHEEFIYEIDMIPKPGFTGNSTATVRIYMAPRYNETGHRFSMDEQWTLFFPMDTFSIDLNGRTKIIRSSMDSTLTVPFAKSYDELEKDDNSTRNYCGCGWPHHLLVPMGNTTGVVFDLFVMISDAGSDTKIVNGYDGEHNECIQSPIICGLFEENYPWKTPMGYPFDRPPFEKIVGHRPYWWSTQLTYTKSKIKNIEDFVLGVPNMATTQVTVTHQNELKSECYSTVRHKF